MALVESGDNPVKLELATASDRVVVTATGAPVPLEDSGARGRCFHRERFRARPWGVCPKPPARRARIKRGADGWQRRDRRRCLRVEENRTSALVLLDGVPVTEPGGGAGLLAPDLPRVRPHGSRSADRKACCSVPKAPSAVIQMFTEPRRSGEPRSPRLARYMSAGSFSTDHWAAGLNGGFADRLDYSFTTDQFRTTSEFPNDAYPHHQRHRQSGISF